MSHALARFGITHLSASALNCWNSNPGLWALRYLHRVRDDAGPKAWRGNAVEAGVQEWYSSRSRDEAVRAALRNFEDSAFGLADDETDGQRMLIAPMVGRAIDMLSTISTPLQYVQLRTETYLDDVPVPIIGYADFVFEDGLIVDLKTTERIPLAKPSLDHAKQVAGYMRARSSDKGMLGYVSQSKFKTHPIVDADEFVADMRRDAMSLMAFLDRFEDATDVLRALPIRADDYKFGAAMQGKAKELCA